MDNNLEVKQTAESPVFPTDEIISIIYQCLKKTSLTFEDTCGFWPVDDTVS